MNDRAVDERTTEGAAGDEGGSGGTKAKTLGLVVGALVVAGALFLVGRELGGYVNQFLAWVEGLGAWAPVIFILGYAVATVAFIPGSALTLAAGATFGLGEGALYAFTGALLGCNVAFLIARYAARSWVEGKLEGKPRFRTIDRAVGRDGGKIVALLRLSPLFPFVLLNYALGLTNVKFSHYFWASFAMIPGTFLYVYYGAVGRAVATADERTAWDWVFLVVGLVATIAVTALITRKATRALRDETGGELADEPAQPTTEETAHV